MKPDVRRMTTRRGHAIDRLRSLTTGAAVAGLAGTAGFGILAAATWSGSPTATTSPTAAGAVIASPNTGEARLGSDSDDGGSGPNTSLGVNVDGSATPRATSPRPSPSATVRPAKGGGHASTGGSN